MSHLTRRIKGSRPSTRLGGSYWGVLTLASIRSNVPLSLAQVTPTWVSSLSDR